MTHKYTLLPSERATFESPISNAPIVELSNGENCIPQHYLRYKHTLASVQNLVLAIEYSMRYPIFVCCEQSNIYIQVGIIGPDNYKKSNKQKNKITYGRKWRIETELPTSEVIQTAFLALKKAREHEVRELFQLQYQGIITTPFNCHHDLPLMAENSSLVTLHEDNHELKCSPITHISKCLSYFRYDKAKLVLDNLEQRKNGTWLIDLHLEKKQPFTLPELPAVNITITLQSLAFNTLCFKLMQAFIQLSDEHVEEHFSYQGFHRFSNRNNMLAIAKLSAVVRGKNGIHQGQHDYQHLVNEIDKTRVPTLDDSKLSQKILANIEAFGELSGMMPHCAK